MFRFLSRWRTVHIVLAWGLYWLGLLSLTVGPCIAAASVATQGADTDQSSVGVSFGSAGLDVAVKQLDTVTCSLTASIPALVFWLVGPPLIIWFLWMVNARRESDRGAPGKLSEGAASAVPVRTPNDVRVHRD